VAVDAAGLDSLAGLSPLELLEDSVVDAASDFVLVSPVDSLCDESDPFDPPDFSEPEPEPELERLSWARVSVL
jgi:hypothetical protein